MDKDCASQTKPISKLTGWFKPLEKQNDLGGLWGRGGGGRMFEHVRQGICEC